MSIPRRTEQDVADDRRMVRLLASALGATSVLICGSVILVGHTLADQPIEPHAARSPAQASLAPSVIPHRAQASLPSLPVERREVDLAPPPPVDLAAPWLASTQGRLSWRND
ncbi:MAG: hypothetical protein RL375_2178 [Pseudomonadota bacterium]